MKTLYLVRHGQARGNAQNLYVGWVDVPLTEEGHRNAHAAADFLRDKPIHAIVSSDLSRAHTTANIIAQHHEIPVLTSERLRERRFGSLEMTPVHYIERYEIASYLPPERCQSANIEHISEFTERITSMYNYLLELAENGPLAVVSHFGVVREVLVAAGITDHANRHIFHPKNGSVYVLQVNDAGAIISAKTETAIILPE